MSKHTPILLLDNFDSFTYNLFHLVRELGVEEVVVKRNNQITVDEASRFDKILLSPGPGIPSEAGVMPDLVRTLGATKSILGVCLGHQCIGEVYGAALENMSAPVHGRAVQTTVTASEEPLFRGLPPSFLTGRYHSWLVAKTDLPSVLTVTAEDLEGNIMAISHTTYDVRGIQFHPESVLTEHGKQLLSNWLVL
jgi:anthranilate synthase component 2